MSVRRPTRGSLPSAPRGRCPAGRARTGALLTGAVALLAAALLLWWAGPDRGAREDVDTPAATHPAPPAQAPRKAAPAAPAPPSGLPRLLPPDAALEDVRDALALEEASARADALHEATRGLARFAGDERRLAALERLRAAEPDPRVRAVALAALGASRDGVHLAWLALRLGRGPAPDRLGALIALAEDPKGQPGRAATLGDLPYRYGALPERSDVRSALATLAPALDAATAADALPIVERTNDLRGGLGEVVAALRAKAR